MSKRRLTRGTLTFCDYFDLKLPPMTKKNGVCSASGHEHGMLKNAACHHDDACSDCSCGCSCTWVDCIFCKKHGSDVSGCENCAAATPFSTWWIPPATPLEAVSQLESMTTKRITATILVLSSSIQSIGNGGRMEWVSIGKQWLDSGTNKNVVSSLFHDALSSLTILFHFNICYYRRQ